MSKQKKYNGDYLVNQVILFSKYFEDFKEKDDHKNMFVILHEIRVIHGMMLIKQNKIIRKISNSDESNSNDFYDLSIFNNIIESTNNLINKYGEYLFSQIKKEKIELHETELVTSEMITNDINQTFKNVDLNDKTIPQSLDKIKDDKEVLLDNIVNPPEKSDQIPSDKKKKYNLSFPSLIYFSKPNCQYCNSFDPVWEELKEKMSDKDLNFIKMDCQKNADKCKDFKIEEVPTIKLFIGRKGIKFSGTRTFDNIKGFINKNISLN